MKERFTSKNRVIFILTVLFLVGIALVPSFCGYVSDIANEKVNSAITEFFGGTTNSTETEESEFVFDLDK